jgi:hypothetical protein
LPDLGIDDAADASKEFYYADEGEHEADPVDVGVFWYEEVCQGGGYEDACPNGRALYSVGDLFTGAFIFTVPDRVGYDDAAV